MNSKLLAVLALLDAAGCTATPSSFPPCLDPNESFMNDCPAPDAGADAPEAADGAADGGNGATGAADGAADGGNGATGAADGAADGADPADVQ